MDYELIEIKPEKRYQKLFDELIYAAESIEKKDALSVVKQIPNIALYLTVRRIKGFCHTMHWLWKNSIVTSQEIFSNFKKGTLKQYISDVFNNCKNKTKNITKNLSNLTKSATKEPKDFIINYGPFFLAFALGFNFASGGLDGDGGLPDLDLEFGIGAHRSILSHGIIMGITAECAIIIISMLADIVIKKLPEEHDKFWDNVSKRKNEIIKGLMVGVGAGMAYHLTIDGTLDIKAYCDLPFKVNMITHKGIMLMQAIIEWIDIPNKKLTPKISETKNKSNKLLQYVKDKINKIKN